ncbi:MAG: hypothetical protein ACHQWH_03680 [Nitrososphaerales archaeon]
MMHRELVVFCAIHRHGIHDSGSFLFLEIDTCTIGDTDSEEEILSIEPIVSPQILRARDKFIGVSHMTTQSSSVSSSVLTEPSTGNAYRTLFADSISSSTEGLGSRAMP